MSRTTVDVAPLLKEAAERLGCTDVVDWYSWPQVFGSTAGPRSGIGGQTLTTFQVFGFVDTETGNGLLCCAGVWKKWKDQTRLSWHAR